MIFVLRYQIDQDTDIFVGSYTSVLQDLIRLLQQRLPREDPHRQIAFPFSDEDQHRIFEVAARRMHIRFDIRELGNDPYGTKARG